MIEKFVRIVLMCMMTVALYFATWHLLEMRRGLVGRVAAFEQEITRHNEMDLNFVQELENLGLIQVNEIIFRYANME